MRAIGKFELTAFEPTEVRAEPEVETGLPVGVATMSKVYTGEIEGKAGLLFTSAFDLESGVGTYVAMESFSGTLQGRAGTFNFVHSATTGGAGHDDRSDEFFLIVPGSGTGELGGITGTGALWVDADGGHHMRFDYELPD